MGRPHPPRAPPAGLTTAMIRFRLSVMRWERSQLLFNKIRQRERITAERD